MELADTGESREHELFIVEGLSAANAIGNVVDPTNQFVYAMQGKPLNAARARGREIAKNERANELMRRILRNRAEGFDPDHIPYSRVILLADADVDGVHAKALLLLLINHLLPDLITNGMLFTVRAPLFAVRCAEMQGSAYAYSADGHNSVLRQLAKKNATGVESNHYKGIASMNSDDIWDACINPDTRHMTPLDESHVAAALAVLR